MEGARNLSYGRGDVNELELSKRLTQTRQERGARFDRLKRWGSRSTTEKLRDGLGRGGQVLEESAESSQSQ